MQDAKSVLGARRMFSGKDKKDAGSKAAAWLAGFHSWIGSSNFAAELERLESWAKNSVATLGPSESLAENGGFASSVGQGADGLERHETDSAGGASQA